MKNKLKRGRWTAEEIRDLKKWFPHISCEACASFIGRPVTAVKKRASRLGLRKAPKYIHEMAVSRATK